jgi:hypothetical protein
LGDSADRPCGKAEFNDILTVTSYTHGPTGIGFTGYQAYDLLEYLKNYFICLKSNKRITGSTKV